MWSSSAGIFHPGAWLIWLAAAMLAALTTRNPFYLGIVIVSALVVSYSLDRAALQPAGQRDAALADPQQHGRGMFLRAIVVLTLIVAVFKGLSMHMGVTVLFTLPENWPVIGGPITLESMVFSALDALSIVAVLAVFAAFSAGADYYAILRSLPAFLHQVGLITSIAITFIPQTVTRFTEIREAQALRGHTIRRVGDLLPVIMPLLSGGMERSMNLAEAMEARGFSRSPASGARPSTLRVQVGLAFGIGLVLTGGYLLALFAERAIIGYASGLIGIVLIAFTLSSVGRGAKRKRLRALAWKERDTVVAAASVGIAGYLLVYRLLEPGALLYYPFPRVLVPHFHIFVAIPFIALALPAVLVLNTGITGLYQGLIRKIIIYANRSAIPGKQASPEPARRTGAADAATHTRHVRE